MVHKQTQSELRDALRFESAQRKSGKFFSEVVSRISSNAQIGRGLLCFDNGRYQMPLCEHNRFAPLSSPQQEGDTNESVKMKRLIVATSLLAVLSGCTSISHNVSVIDSTKRERTTSIELIPISVLPTRPYKKIALLQYTGPSQVELDAMNYFRDEAKKLGGDAVIFDDHPAHDLQISVVRSFGAANQVYNYKAGVIVWTDK